MENLLDSPSLSPATVSVNSVTAQDASCSATWLASGSNIGVGEIPPGTEAYFNSAECAVQLSPGCKDVHAIGFIPHAHFLGTAVWTEHYSADKFGQLTYVRCFFLIMFVASSPSSLRDSKHSLFIFTCAAFVNAYCLGSGGRSEIIARGRRMWTVTSTTYAAERRWEGECVQL
jgi:hypothetical protein